MRNKGLFSIVVISIALLFYFSKGEGVQETGSCSWRSLGPQHIPEGEGYDGTRVEVSGRVTAIQINPLNPSVIYVGSALGGVWRSNDEGNRWMPMSDFEESLAIGALLIHPKDTGTILAGTGEGSIAFFNQIKTGDRALTGHRGAGILKSTDGGRHWEQKGKEHFASYAFSGLACHPAQPDLVLAATTKGLFKSEDFGDSWLRMTNSIPLNGALSMATSVVFHPEKRNTAYAAFWGRGIYRSDNIQSANPDWELLVHGLPLSNINRIGLTISPVSPYPLYALISNADSYLRGLYYSIDAGESWDEIKGAPDIMNGQGFFNLMIGPHQEKSDAFFIGGSADREEYKSSFVKVTKYEGEWLFIALGSEMHIDFHSIAFSPDPSTIYVGNDGGIWKTFNDGLNWISCNRGLNITQFTRIDQHAGSPDFIIGGTQDNGTLRYKGDPQWEHCDDGDGGFVAIDPQDPSCIYNEFFLYKIARSNDFGRYGTFKPIYPELKFYRSVFQAPFVLNPQHSNTIALGMEKIYISEDGGVSWKSITDDLSNGSRTRFETNAISSLAFPRSDLIFAGTSDGRLWCIRKINKAWYSEELKGKEQSASLNSAYITDLKWLGPSANTLLVSTDTREHPSLWKVAFNQIDSFPLATQWAPLVHNAKADSIHLPVLTIEWSSGPESNSTIFIGTDKGVYTSNDFGQNWQDYNDGLPRTTISDLQINKTYSLLRAASFGRGVWERDLSGKSCNRVELNLKDHFTVPFRKPEDFKTPCQFDTLCFSSPDIKLLRKSEVDFHLFNNSEGLTSFENESRIFVHVANKGGKTGKNLKVRLYLTHKRIALESPIPKDYVHRQKWKGWELIEELSVDKIQPYENLILKSSILDTQLASFENLWIMAVTFSKEDIPPSINTSLNICQFVAQNQKAALLYLRGKEK